MVPLIALNHAFVYFSIQNYTEDKRHFFSFRRGLHLAIPVMNMFPGVGAIFHNCSAIFSTLFFFVLFVTKYLLKAPLLYQHEKFYRDVSLQTPHHTFVIVNDREKPYLKK